MADLIAQGMEPQHRWRRTLEPNTPLILGRGMVSLPVPWDERVSREHADLIWQNGQLEISRRPTARNAIFIQGEEVTHTRLKPGQSFVIGRTTFTIVADQANVSLHVRAPVEEQTFSAAYLQNEVRFRDADQKFEVLSRLPDVILGSTTDQELFVRLANMLLAGIPRAEAVAVVSAQPTPEGSLAVEVLYWDRRRDGGPDFQPSQRLILESLTRKQGVVHLWGMKDTPANSNYTMHVESDWAFSIPVNDKVTDQWAIYVAGRLGSARTTPNQPADVREDMKFTELVAGTLGALRQVRRLQRQNAVLSQFFSPVVLNTMSARDAEAALSPRETNVTVLFCDLRGFSLEAEKSSADLLGLLERVSRALGVMTSRIREFGGVIGDYQGDAAMGFWGWPLEQADSIQRACLAALAIRQDFEAAAREPNDPLAGFRVGIGVAYGRAVAGKIGTHDQVKVTVFGPVVNLASRLEGMTKILRAPILIDSLVARAVRQTIPESQARCRRLAVVKPYGLGSPIEVSELLPPLAQYPQLTDEHIKNYEAAVEALQAGRWSEAFDHLHRVPPDDRVKDFLTVLIAQHNRTPPTNWDGVIRLTSKS
jgi:adenylate cyclase